MRKALMGTGLVMLACSYDWDTLDPRLGEADLGGSGPAAGSSGDAGSEAAAGAVFAGAGPGAGTAGQGGSGAVSAGSSGWAGADQAGAAGLAGSPAAAAGTAGLAGHAGSAAAGSAGSSGAGGASATGGAAGAGGTAATGGTAGDAGAVATGGAVATSGAAGTGGGVSTGGATGTGGAVSTGGVVSTGGAVATGGAAGAAGAVATGGTGATAGSCSDTVCGSDCVDLSSSTDHCGACDRACSGSHVDTMSCSGGVCDSSCSGAWLNCIQPAAPAADDGCETNGDTSTNDCGGCGVSCPRYEVCQDGCTVPCSGAGLEVLFVVGNTTLGVGDAAVRDWLEAQLGFTVSIVDDTASQTSDADGKALVVISSTCDSPEVGTKFTDVAVPIATGEVALYDDLNMTSATGWNVHTGQTALDVVDPTHPLAAGLDGTLTLFTAASDVGSAAAQSSAAVVATLAGDDSRAVLFAYETGAAMYGGFTAPARRLGLPYRDLGPDRATEDAERLGLVAFCWAAGLYP
jgi:hypothetical protein